jgi:coenzyme F420-0:L-glutamate ligase/coenzyme F420-1:gamma-L-glutamate ligase
MVSHRFSVIPIKSQKMFGSFHLGRTVANSIARSNEKLIEGDIVVVSSKFAAIAEGRFVDLRKIRPSNKARSLALRYDLDPSVAEIVINESEAILGGIRGFALAVSKGILAPNAGIDRSNAPHGYAILYPKDPSKTTQKLRTYLIAKSLDLSKKKKKIAQLGVVLSDSRVTPTRLGTIGIAIAASGFKSVVDFRGKKDLFGNKLKVTVKAVADQISSAAQLVMGEASESIPIVIIRGYQAEFVDFEESLSMTIPFNQCLYVQGLKNSVNQMLNKVN